MHLKNRDCKKPLPLWFDVDHCDKLAGHQGDCGPRGPWDRWSINKRLLKNLRRRFRTREFTLKKAYWIYSHKHAKLNGFENGHPVCYTSGEGDGYGSNWNQMNVRNTLCAAAYHGLLLRTGPGTYQFPKEN